MCVVYISLLSYHSVTTKTTAIKTPIVEINLQEFLFHRHIYLKTQVKSTKLLSYY